MPPEPAEPRPVDPIAAALAVPNLPAWRLDHIRQQQAAKTAKT